MRVRSLLRLLTSMSTIVKVFSVPNANFGPNQADKTIFCELLA